ncbi:MAG: glycosyltransferase family 4 protein [Candidatus Nealsonbacteria bacterium]
MKILLVQPYALGPGHYEAYTQRLCAGFCKLSVDTTLITAAGTRGGWENELPLRSLQAMKANSSFLFTLDAGKKLQVIDRVMGRIRFLWTSWVVERVAFTHFVKDDYDILHFIDAEPITLSILFLLFGKPQNVFLTIPAPYTIPARGKSIYRYTYDPLRRAMARWLFKYIKPITHSQHVKKSLFNLKIVSKVEVPVIPWGIDTPSLTCNRLEARQKLGIKEDSPILGFFGYLLPQKGFDLVLKTWPSLNQKCLLLAFVHSDRPGGESKIRNRVQEAGINNRTLIKFGYASEKELALHIRACDGILLPYQKTFQGESGIMALALSHQIPLIAANTGRIGEVVSQNNLGIIFKPDSSLSFKEGIDKFLNFKKEEINQIKKNINLYTKLYSWKEIANQHLMAYQKDKKYER